MNANQLGRTARRRGRRWANRDGVCLLLSHHPRRNGESLPHVSCGSPTPSSDTAESTSSSTWRPSARQAGSFSSFSSAGVRQVAELDQNRRHVRRFEDAEAGIAVRIVDQADLAVEGRDDLVGEADREDLRLPTRQVHQDVGDALRLLRWRSRRRRRRPGSRLRRPSATAGRTPCRTGCRPSLRGCP